nr:hypothetical protein [uncultured Roseateles sp.]
MLAKRFPRERFTRALTTICTRLDVAHEVEFDYASSPRDLVPVHGRLFASVRVVWAFGSWAQGSETCGDLDLAADIACEWVGGIGWMHGDMEVKAVPGFDTARKAVLPVLPYVHVLDAVDIRKYGATGQMVVHPDSMKPIWISPNLSAQELGALDVEGRLANLPQLDWLDRIDAVKGNPDASRMPRSTDALPLRLEQTAMSLLSVEAAIRALDQGLIAWRFRPHGVRRKDAETLTPSERHLAGQQECNDDEMISRVLAGTRDVRKRHKNVVYRYGNNCGVRPRIFDRRNSSCVVITPKWSAQGPNGSLVVTKGPRYTKARVEAFEAAERKLEAENRQAEFNAGQVRRSIRP